eukprot:g15501.t1
MAALQIPGAMDAPESPSGGTRAAEVDTEIEDNGMANASEHLDQFAGDEIDEELDPPADHRTETGKLKWQNCYAL